MQSEIQLINKNIEKSNTLLKKFKLLYKNNYEVNHAKTKQVTFQLIEHLKQAYNFELTHFESLIKSYKTDSEIIKTLGGKEIARFISLCLENYLKNKDN